MVEATDRHSVLAQMPAATAAREKQGQRRTRNLLLQARERYHDVAQALRNISLAEKRAASPAGASAHPRNHDLVTAELVEAGHIQAGLLPDAVPYLPGWDLAATLEPALETWGDFFDFIPLPCGRLGIVVADVVDKGMGAALYMALTRTLLRSCAPLNPQEPGETLAEVNARIMAETHTGMFVTLFYGVLDPEAGSFRYANGGHNPAYLFGPDEQDELVPTGMALGVVPDVCWETHTLRLTPGDTLFLYTDGAIDARAPDGDTFGLERLLSTVQAHLGHPCTSIQAAVLDEIHRFVGRAPRFDDVTLMVVTRT
ncbi:MAG: PP2C family protein-serine/threonine phosphatase [Anaerolineae bacterium]